MATKKQPTAPPEFPYPGKRPEMDPDEIPDITELPDEDPDIIPDDDPFEIPPEEIPLPDEED